jgi:hypothetical protein
MQEVGAQREGARLGQIRAGRLAVPAVLVEILGRVELQPIGIVQEDAVGLGQMKADRVVADLLYPVEDGAELGKREGLPLEVFHVEQHGVRIEWATILKLHPLTQLELPDPVIDIAMARGQIVLPPPFVVGWPHE